jgi:hypothetical protein
MRLKDKIKKVIVAGISAAALMLTAYAEYYPSLDTTLNDFDPEVAVGEYIQSIASNTVSEAVVLSNGVLTVNGETINVAEPTHTVITTNGSEIVTNVYNAIYEDGLANTLTNYATIVKTTVTTNGTEIITNTTSVAYLDDIPPDSQKADKVMRLWDYQSSDGTTLLTRKLNRDAPFAFWEGTNTADEVVSLFYTNGIWTVESGSTRDEVYGTEDAALIQFPNYSNTFSMVNDTRYAFVVYTDMLDSEMSRRLEEYVPTTNLLGISSRIENSKLHTLGGIQEILVGIREEINSMASGRGIHLTFNNVGGSTLVLAAAETRIPDDMVSIDWGDGSGWETTHLPATHTYAIGIGRVDVVISGFIREISGSSTRDDTSGGFPFASFLDNDNSRLVSVEIDPIVGLESIGALAFYGCSGLAKDLTFIPDTVTNLSERCFENSGIIGLSGIPSEITVIPSRCFSGCSGLRNLSGLSPGIVEIGNEAFADCRNISSTVGIPQAVTTLGVGVFSGCSSLTSVEGLSDTAVNNIPASGFQSSGLTSLSDFPLGVTNIGDYAFAGSKITSIDNPFGELAAIGQSAFQDTPLQSINLSDATLLTSIGSDAFKNTVNLTSVALPSNIVTIGTYALAGVNGTIRIDKMASEIMGMTSFSWDVSTTSVFVALDGEIYYEDLSWKVRDWTTTLMLSNVAAGSQEVSLGVIVPEQPQRSRTLAAKRANPSFSILVDWGDGTVNAEKSHTYDLSAATNLKITVIGKLDSIGGTIESPFVTVGGSATNAYLTAVEFGDMVNIRALGDSTFKNCPSLSTDNIKGIGSSLVSLGESCFEGTAVRDLTFLANSSVVEYPVGCFRHSTLTSLDGMSHNVESVGDECFKGCASLYDTSGISPNLRVLGGSAFEDCIALDNGSVGYVAATKVDSLPTKCFKGCTNLTALTSGLDGIRSIGSETFANCTRMVDISINSVTNVGRRAFEAVGSDLSVLTRMTEDNIPYKVLVDITGQNFMDAAELLGLEAEGSPESGLVKESTIVNCSDNASLVWSNASTPSRWEVLLDALNVSLANVPSNCQFQVQSGGVRAIPGAMLIWNWGDGTNSGWVDGVPQAHTYTNGGTSNYLVKIKGLLSSVSSGENVGPFIRQVGSTENPYLVGYEIPAGSTVSSMGNYTFSRCPNLKEVNRINLPTRAMPMLKKKTSARDSGRSLAKLYEALSSASGHVEYGDYCFRDSGLQSIDNFPKDATTLADGLFSNCESLSSIEGLGNGILDMGVSCFAGDISLRSLDGFPSSLTYIANNGFQGCYGLTSLAGLYGSGLSSIGDYSFYDCGGISSLEGLPPYVEYIGIGAFGKTGIRNMSGYPSLMRYIPEYGFFMSSLESVSNLSENVASVEEAAFMGCNKLQTVSLDSSGVGNLSDRSFAYCPSLSTIELASGVTNIGAKVFESVGSHLEPTMGVEQILASTRVSATSYTSEEMIALLQAHSNLEQNVEFNCKDAFIIGTKEGWAAHYKDIRFVMVMVPPRTPFYLGTVEPVEGTSVVVDWGDGSEEEYRPGLVHQYAVYGDYTITLKGFVKSLLCTETEYPIVRVAENGNPYLLDIFVGGASMCQSLGNYCFKGCHNLFTLVGMTASIVAQLGRECFAECEALEHLDGLPPTLVELGEGCFRGCTALGSLEGIQEGISVIPTNCFADCSGLANITNLPSTVVELQMGCFRGCSSLVNLEGLTNCVELTLGDFCFADCTSLSDFSGFNTNVYSLSKGMAAGCTNLSSFAGLPTTLSTIPEQCFMGCSGLRSLASLPENYAVFKDEAFRGGGLTSLVGMSSNVVSIGSLCFSQNSLTSLAGISENIWEVGAYAFADNALLDDISDIERVFGLNNIPTGCFSGCELLGSGTEFSLPTNVTQILEEAFYGCSAKGLHHLPPYCEYIASNAFAHTKIESLVITNSTVLIDADAFRDEQNETELFYKGFPYYRQIIFPELTCAEIQSYDGFPWGAGEKTMFVGKNGFITYRNGEMVNLTDSIKIGFEGYFNPYTSAAIELRAVTPADDFGYCIDWGDGTYSNWCNANSTNVHAYAVDVGTSWITNNYEIILRRPIRSFGDSSGKAPYFITRGTITSVEITEESELESLGDYAFVNFQRITEFPALPSTVTNLGNYCFSGIQTPAITNLPAKVRSIGVGAFRNCSQLTNVVLRLPELVGMSSNLFEGCSSLSTATLSCPALTEIGDYAFYGNTNLVSIDISNTRIERIGASAFENCYNLPSLDFLEQINFVGKKAFNYLGRDLPNEEDPMVDVYRKCKVFFHLNTVEGITNTEGMKADNILAMSDRRGYMDTLFRCSDGYIKFEKLDAESLGWKYYTPDTYFQLKNVPNGTTIGLGSITNFSNRVFTVDWGNGTIVSNCYTGADAGTIVVSGSGDILITIKGALSCIGGLDANKPMVYIQDEDGNPYLTEVGINQSIWDFKINDYAFVGCSNLTNIDNLVYFTKVGVGAFKGCTSLRSMILSENCQKIEDQAFSGSGLTNLICRFPSPYTNYQIGNEVFTGCSNLVVTIEGTNFPAIASNAFNGAEDVSVICTWIDADRIQNQSTFPFDSTGRSEVTYDAFEGLLHRQDGSWVIDSSLISISITTPEIAYERRDVHLQNLLPYDYPEKTIVDWGDGVREELKQLRGHYTGLHYYVEDDLQVWIRIRGRFEEISGSDGQLPFVTTYIPSKRIAVEVPANVTGFRIGDRVGVKRIGEATFFGYKNLTDNIYISESVTNLGFAAFAQSGINSLTNIPTNISTYPDYCFKDCRNLTSLEGMSPLVRSLGIECFKDCKLTSLQHLSRITEVSQGCFAGNEIESLKYLPDSITYLPDECFANNKLKTFEDMPQTISGELGNNALSPFYGTNLVGLSTNITSLGDNFLEDSIFAERRASNGLLLTPNLISLDGLPPGVTSIPQESFRECPPTTFLIPPQVTNIAYNAFSRGTKLLLSPNSPRDIIDPRLPWFHSKDSPTPTWNYPTNGLLTVYGNGFVQVFQTVPNGVRINSWSDYVPSWSYEFWLRKIDIEPTIKSVFNISEDNTTVRVGNIVPISSSYPMYCDWGDGAVEFGANTVPTSHTYAHAGIYTNVITMCASEIDGVDGKPFWSIDGHDINECLTEFEFTDFVGIWNIGARSFERCPNLTRIECKGTSGDDEEYIRNIDIADLPTIHYFPIDNFAFMDMPSYPFGYEGNRTNIIGVDGPPSAYIQFVLNGVNAQTVFTFGELNAATNSRISIHWGDGTHHYRINTVTGSSHKYENSGNYIITIFGTAEEDLDVSKFVVNQKEVYSVERDEWLVESGLSQVPLLYSQSVIPGGSFTKTQRVNVRIWGQGITSYYYTHTYYTDTAYIYANNNLTSVEISPEFGIRRITGDVFNGTGVIVTHVGQKYWNSPALRLIDLPSSLDYLAPNAFAGTSISQVRYSGNAALPSNLFSYNPGSKSLTFDTAFKDLTIEGAFLGPWLPSACPQWYVKFNANISEVRGHAHFPFCIGLSSGETVVEATPELEAQVPSCSFVIECNDGRLVLTSKRVGTDFLFSWEEEE